MRMVGIRLEELRCDHGRCAGSCGSKQRTSFGQGLYGGKQEDHVKWRLFWYVYQNPLRSKPREWLWCCLRVENVIYKWLSKMAISFSVLGLAHSVGTITHSLVVEGRPIPLYGRVGFPGWPGREGPPLRGEKQSSRRTFERELPVWDLAYVREACNSRNLRNKSSNCSQPCYCWGLLFVLANLVFLLY